MFKNPFFIFDLLYILFSLIIYTLSLSPSLFILKNYWADSIIINALLAFISYFLFLNLFVITIGLFRSILQPRLVEGEFPIGLNRKYAGWVLNSLFQGIFIASPFAKQCNFIFYLNYIFYKMMGMNLDHTVLIGMNTTIRQAELISIGKKSIIGLGAIISCHYSPSGKTHVQKRVTIGNNSVIGGFSGIAPGVSVGDNSVVGARCSVYPDVKIGNNVRIGVECSIKFGSIIPDNVKIKSNTVIDKNCAINPGETWAGNPAVRVS